MGEWSLNIVPASSFVNSTLNVPNICIYEWLVTSSAIHKAAGLTVPGRSMILPGTIPETPISREWSQQLEHPPDHVLYGGRPYGGFVNSAVRIQRLCEYPTVSVASEGVKLQWNNRVFP